MNHARILFIITLLMIVSCSAVIGQNIPQSDSTKLYRVELKDGSFFIGEIISSDTALVVFKTNAVARMELDPDKISKIEEIEKSSMNQGVYWFPNPNPTRYLFGPSAINLKAGEGYYQNTWLFLNSFNVGVTDYFSVGGGLEFISTFATLAQGDFQPIFILTPKVGFKVQDKLHLGGGILYASLPSFDDEGSNRTGLGIAYGIGTYGSADHNFTFGTGLGFVDQEFSKNPIITFSGMTRIARKTALVTENWLVYSGDSYYGMYSYGIRFFGEKLAIDLAFVNNADIAEVLFIGIPVLDFMVKF